MAEIKNLGISYNKEYTDFKIWAPSRNQVDLLLYTDYRQIRPTKYPMDRVEDGCFYTRIEGNLDGLFYRYLLNNKYEVTDPYSIGSSINSLKSAIINLSDTDPEGFRQRSYIKVPHKEAVIYEVHVKDFSAHDSSGVKNKGRFLGFVQSGKCEDLQTGLDHIESLGVTHVHLLPVADFLTVDERPEKFFDDDNYNWGYDPELFNVLEGSYATNPYNPKNRIREFKTLVDELHKRNIGVVLDVVYNHTYKSIDSNFNTIYPGYYYRSFDGKNFANGSGTGNEMASEKEMVRAFIIDSLKFWQEEYMIDGFRFDLMGLIDKETMGLIRDELRKTNPYSLIYGEPWTAQDSPLAYEDRVLVGSQKSQEIAIFNPNFRDSLKGLGDGPERGYLQGNLSLIDQVKEGISGSIGFVNDNFWICDEPWESINYYNSHDNLILVDKLKLSLGDVSENHDISMLATSIIMTSQGIPFLHAGNEFFRDKKMIRNSYRSPLEVNAIDWNYKKTYFDMFKYTQDIISLRNEFKEYFTLSSKEIGEKFNFIEELPEDIIGYEIEGTRGKLIIFHTIKWDAASIDLEKLISQGKNLDFRLIFDKSGSTNRPETNLNNVILSPISTKIFLGERKV